MWLIILLLFQTECKKTKATLDNPAKGIYPNSETGIANDVFTSDGWSPGTGKKEILNLVLDSQSDAVLERIEFVVRNASGTTLELNVNTKESTNNFLVYNKNYNVWLVALKFH